MPNEPRDRWSRHTQDVLYLSEGVKTAHTPSIGGCPPGSHASSDRQRTAAFLHQRLWFDNVKPHKKTATERALEAAEREGVQVTVRKSRPGSGFFIARPGRGPVPPDEPSDDPHPEGPRTS
jgi:hypothetical protein